MSKYLAKGFLILLAVAGLRKRLVFADEGKGASGTKGDTSGGADDNQADDDASGKDGGKSVSYDTYRKTLGEAKKAKAELKALSDRLAAIESDKLLAEGKKDEAYIKLKTDFDKLSKTHKETLNGFVFSSLDGQVREAAAKAGCVDLDAVGKLVDLSEIEVDTKTFRADKNAIADVIDGLKKAKPYLFNKAAPKLNTKMPTGQNVTSGGKKLKELSKEEIFDQLRALGTKN